jgi:hypothetical protein
MPRVDAYRMMRRRIAAAGFTQKLGCHNFRAPVSPPISTTAARSKTPRLWNARVPSYDQAI